MMWGLAHTQKNELGCPAAYAVHSRSHHRHHGPVQPMVYSEADLFDYLRVVCLRAGNRAAAAALRFFPYGKFEIQLKRPERHLWCGLNGSARNAAYYRKQARRSSDTSPEAKTSL